MTTESPSSSASPVSSIPRPPSPRARNKKGAGIGRWLGLAVFVAIIALIASTVRPGRGAFVYSKYVHEVMAEPQRFVGTDLRVEGVVEAGSIENRAGSNEYRFRIESQRQTLPVLYSGIVPDTFREGIGVTVQGRLDSNGVFTAREVVAKCPSKYEMEAAQSRGQTMPHGPQPRTP
jgi:cytochrome c-type biogenesis protein CcmE